MARVKISEYAAKSLLVEEYSGVSLQVSTLHDDIEQLDSEQRYIIKVDQGIKKRGKQGLLRLNITKQAAAAAVEALAKRGFERFIAEPMLPHDDNEEQYLSIERVRTGFQILHSPKGGVDIEDNPDSITTYTEAEAVPLPRGFVDNMIDIMNREHLSFLEINPLVVRGEECILLDAAVLADSAGSWRASWSEGDIVEATTRTHAEQVIADLNDNSPASFSLRVLNPNGAIWLLLSGGGASITIADEAANQGKADLIGNYGEYSGGPTREETQIYTSAVLDQCLLSKAPRKAIILAGGVANFTDVRKTFAGIIDALTARMDELKAAGITVYVRRGGPNEVEGLAMMERFLKHHDIFGSMHGSADVLTVVIDEALEVIDA